MVEVRISREAIEVLADEGSVGGVTRADAQVAALHTQPVEVQASRVAVEVLADEGSVGGVTRADAQIAALHTQPVEVQVSRIAIEVLASPDSAAAVTRLDAQVAATATQPVEVQASRIAIEVLARQGTAGPVAPLALADDSHIFMHNWVAKAKMNTSFRNSVSPSPVTGASSRRGLNIKPQRTLELEWLVCPGTTFEDLERLEVLLRRMTDQRFQVPIYMDQFELVTSYLSSATTVAFDTSKGRYFAGARVVIVQFDANWQVSSFSFHTIDSLTNASLTFTSSLGVAVAAGSIVMPVIDCEVMLDVEADYRTARVPRISMTVSEVPGASQLPALKTDTPTGAEVYAEAGEPDRPIWFEEPNWVTGIKKGRSRQGSRTREGRADFVDAQADRSRQTHTFELQGERDEMWNVLEFFETRRGMLRSFWLIDQDQYLECVSIDASGTFIGVAEIGDLADFSEEMAYIGLVMDDGAIFVRKAVTIQQILTVFRVTLDQTITAGLSPTNVYRVARARHTTFASEEFTEEWTHAGLMNCKVSFIEVLNEGDVSTT